MPYASAAVGAYGGAVLAKARDEAADATVGLGRRLLQRIFGSHQDGELPEPVAAVVADPTDKKALEALGQAIDEALAASPKLKAKVRRMLKRTTRVTQKAGRDAIFTEGDVIQTTNNYAGTAGPPSLRKPPRAGINKPETRRVGELEYSTEIPHCPTRPNTPMPQQTPRPPRRKSQGNEY
jgi:hypothetical protein